MLKLIEGYAQSVLAARARGEQRYARDLEQALVDMADGILAKLAAEQVSA